MIDVSELLKKYHLPKPMLEQELSFEGYRQMAMNMLRDFWATDKDLQAVAPTFEAWMIQTPLEAVMVRLAAFRDMFFVANMNDWARAVLIVFFCFGEDLDKLAENEGLERFPDETDPRLQERIVLTRRGKWGPGSDAWYIMHARNADGRVREVALTAKGRRELEVAILSDEQDGTPSDELIEAVTERLTRNNVCRGNDIILVTPAVIVSLTITARVTLLPTASEAILDGLSESIVSEWNDATERLGRDLTSSWLISRLQIPGVYSVTSDFQTFEAASNRAVGLKSLKIEVDGRAR